jgi:hypothetical protein
MKIKKGLILLILVLSILIPFSVAEKCYVPSVGECANINVDFTAEMCEATEADGGAGGFIAINGECNTGCCCEFHPLDDSFTSSTGYVQKTCLDNSENLFYENAPTITLCQQKCNDITQILQDEGSLPQCMDGEDNDGDGLVDMDDIADCKSQQDNSEYPSAEDTECTNTIDEDNDGLLDYFGLYEDETNDAYDQYQDYLDLDILPDPCCTKEFGVSETCSFPECNVGNNTQLCECGNDVCGFPWQIEGNEDYDYESKQDIDIYPYVTGSYCCEGECSFTPCGDCEQGQEIFETTPEGKVVYVCECDDAGNCEYKENKTLELGTFEECKDALGNQGFGLDQDKDNLPNCLDTDCYGVECSNAVLDKSNIYPGTSLVFPTSNTCRFDISNPELSKFTLNGVEQLISFYDGNDELWRCCFPDSNGLSRVKDCDDDTVPDTCGECECLSLHKQAVDLQVDHILGEPRLNLSYYFECKHDDIQLKMMRCDGTPAECGFIGDNELTLENSGKFIDISASMTCDIIDTDGTIKSVENCLVDIEKNNNILEALLQPAELTDFTGLFDNNIQAGKDYTYVVKSIYPDGTITFSKPAHIITGNNEICFQQTGHFCIRDEGFDIDSARYRYYCDDSNDLFGGENAEDDYICGDAEICVESLSGSNGIQTSCETQTPCIFCGTPFNMYGYKDSASISEFPDGFMELDSSDFDNNCMNAELCYYDYSSTIKDAYDNCARVDNCYDYRSEDACGENKCLPYDCEWNISKAYLDSDDILDEFDLDVGYCHDPDEDVKNCELCNKLDNNKVFSYCSLEMCRGFSTSDTQCFLNNEIDNTCVSSELLTCSNYNIDYPDSKSKVEQDCTDGIGLMDGQVLPGLNLDVLYDGNNRVWGTNKIIQASPDLLGFGVCKYDDGKCIKDSDDDGKEDPKSGKKPTDITPPITEVISNSNSDKIELKFSVNDPVVGERYHSKPEDIKTYYCFPGDDEISQTVEDYLLEQEVELVQYKNDDGKITEKELGLCYPDNLYKSDEEPILPEGNGHHTVFFYSVDEAHNLEEVKSFKFNVDIMPPNITITPYVTNDLAAPYDDTHILFAVELDEPADECHDIFEGYTGVEEINFVGGQYFQAKYEGLTDGSYLYTVVCTDYLDNTINKTITVKVDADQEIQSTLPQGVLDYSPVNLEILTHKNGDCRFGQSSTFALLTSFGEPELLSTNGALSTYKYSHPISIEEDGIHKYKVMCQFTQFPEEREDEIQFVMDTTPPHTRLIDAKGNSFNTSQWYSGEFASDMAYLECLDEPEFGFGCNESYYCIQAGSLKCKTKLEEPSPLIDSYAWYTPIDIEQTSGKQWLCYHSQELSSIEKDMGGLKEEKQCVQLLQDSNQGPDIIVPLLVQNDEPTNPYYYSSAVIEDGVSVGFLLEGNVIDTDASTSPPDNKLDISVYPLDEDYLEQIELLTQSDDTEELSADDLALSETFENLEANNAFSQEINLMPGLNRVLLEAVDRSGEWTSQEFFIMVNPFNGELLEIIEPPKGVSKLKEFDLIVKTSDDLPAPEKCMLSTNANIGFAYDMEQIEPRKFKNEIKFPGMINGIYYTVFIKCDFAGGISDQTSIDLVWDETAPSIEKLFVNPSDGKDPATIVEFPLITNLSVSTDDKARCKYSTTQGIDYFSMSPFDKYETKNLSFVNEHELTNLIDGQEYTYYVRCDNGPTEPASNHISEEETLTFSIDTSQFTGFTIVNPEPFTSDTSIDFELHSTKQASDCTFGPDEETVDLYSMETIASGVDAFKVHFGPPVSLTEGEHTFYFRCLTQAEGPITDSYTFSIDTTPPTLIVITDPYTSSLYTLSANWDADDEYSEIDEYNYSIGTEPGLADVFEWDPTTDHKEKESNLNLSNETTYYWNVAAKNSVGLWSEIVSSNGTYVDTSYNPGFEVIEDSVSICANSIQDLGESDVDCGGTCSGCGNGKNCGVNVDCISNQCISGICVGSSCDDGILNQQEADIDCGGPCSGCDIGMDCDYDVDCSSGFCYVGTCQQPTCEDGFENGDELGVDCGGSCLGVCDIPTAEPDDETCNDGIKNQNEEGIDCGGSCSDCDSPEPVEPKDGPSLWWVWLLLLLLISGLAGGGFYYYKTTFLTGSPLPKNMDQQMQAQRSQSSRQQPRTQRRVQSRATRPLSTQQPKSQVTRPINQRWNKTKEEKRNKRDALLNKFDDKGKKNKDNIRLKLKEIGDKFK